MTSRIILSLVLTCACIYSQAQVGIITTICGDSIAGYSGDNGPCSNAKLKAPEYLCLDKDGNIFIADCENNRVRKIDHDTKVITTIAGGNIFGYNGDNIPAITAELFVPEAICTDTAGNIFIADGGNNRVRKITVSTGVITTVAGIGPSGIGVGGSAGDGGSATNAELDAPIGLCVDNSGNIYIGDYYNNKVRRVDALTGIITTFAGKQGPLGYTSGFVGYSGDGGSATDAVLSGPLQVFADSVGNVYICDQWNHAIRKVDISSGIITTIAGTGIAGYSGNGGLAIHAQLNQPGGIDMDKQGNIYIAEYGNGVIRKIDAETGIISTVAGTDTLGFSGDGGPATDAELRCSDVRVNNLGTIYIADIDNNRIRKVYNPKLAIPNNTPQIEIVKLYPNPAKATITVAYSFAMGADGEIQITDITGRLIVVKTLSSQKSEEEINISSLSAGLYLYKVVQNTMLISAGKIIKE